MNCTRLCSISDLGKRLVSSASMLSQPNQPLTFYQDIVNAFTTIDKEFHNNIIK